MTIEDAPRQGLVARVVAILTRPTQTWPQIAAEPMTPRQIYLGYVAPLAAIGPICGLIGSQLVGFSLGGVSFKPPLLSAAAGALLSYGLAFVGVFVLSLIIDALAPTFHARQDKMQALKLSAFSATAAWLAGVFGLVPMLFILGVVGLYSIYLLYTGIIPLMGVPKEKAAPYTALAALIALIVMLIASVVSNSVMRIAMVPPVGAVSSGGRLGVPGGDVDLGELERAGRALEAQAKASRAGAEGKAPIIPGDELQALLPGELPGGYLRTAVSNATGGSGPMAMANAQGTYVKGDSRVTIEVTDLGPVGALAGAFNVRASKDTGAEYSKVYTQGGRMITEEYNRDRNGGAYTTVIANRFAVKAEGDKVTIGDLKGAVEAVSSERLEAMAKG